VPLGIVRGKQKNRCIRQGAERKLKANMKRFVWTLLLLLLLAGWQAQLSSLPRIAARDACSIIYLVKVLAAATSMAVTLANQTEVQGPFSVEKGFSSYYKKNCFHVKFK